MNSSNADSIASIDLSDVDLYEHGDPDAVWAELRAADPVHWNHSPARGGFWAITRYSDALSAYRHHAALSSEHGMMLGVGPGGDPSAGRMLVVTDPPRHGALRRLIAGYLTPEVMERLTTMVEGLAQDLVRRAVERGTADFVDDLAARIPVAVICDILGVPPADREMMRDLTDVAFTFDDLGAQSGRARARAHAEILSYYTDLMAARRIRPGNDIITRLATSRIDGRFLTDEEIILNCDNLILGGNETTRHAAVGGALAFMDWPDEWATVRRHPEALPAAVEEVLRWTAPGMHVLRTAVEPMQIGSVRIEAGQAVTIWNGSANRDDDAFPNASVFSVSRRRNPHLSFGGGVHRCLGAALARMELRVLFRTLADHSVGMERTGAALRLRSNLIRGYRSLPVHLTTEAT